MTVDSSPVLSRLTSLQEAPRRGKPHLPHQQQEDELAKKRSFFLPMKNEARQVQEIEHREEVFDKEVTR